MKLIKKTKHFCYLLHIFFIFSTIFLPFYNIKYFWLQSITITSWNINNNKCLITQFENYLYNETLIQFYYNKILKRNKIIVNLFEVPFFHRTIIYILYFINLYKYIMYNDYYTDKS